MLLLLLFLGLSVAFSLFTAMRLANRTVLREFRGAVESLAGASPFQIVGTTRYFDAADVVPLLLNAKTLQSFLPIRVDEATIISPTGEEQRITLIGVDMTHERVSKLGPSTAGGDQASEEGGNAFFQYRALVASSHLRGYARDKRLVFWVEGEGEKPLEVHFQEEHSSEFNEEESPADGLLGLHGGKAAVADLSLVDLLLGAPGRLSEISLFPKTGVGEDEFVAEISALLPPYMLLSFPDERFQSVSETSSALRMNLVFLGALSLFVGMLLGFQVMRLLVLRREGDHTILLALGLSPRSLGMLVLLESAAIGAASGLLGGLLGSGFGIFIVEGVQQTVSHLYEPLYERALIFDVRILLESMFVGILVGSVAGMLALRRLFTSSSLVRGREFHFEQGSHSPSVRYPLLGGAVLILGVLATSKEVIINPLLLEIGVAPFLAPCAIALAALLIAPSLVWYSVSLLILVFRYFGWSVAVVLALEGIKTRIRDAGIAVAALGVAFGMLLGIVTMISGFQATFEDWLEKVLRADLYLSFPEGRATAKDQQEELANELRGHPFVSGVHVGREERYEYRGRQIFIRQSDLQLLHREEALVILSKEPIDFERVFQGQDVLVTEPFCNRFQCRVGDQIQFPRMRHNVTDGNIKKEEHSAREPFHAYTISGVLQDFSTDLGAVLLPPTQYRELFGNEGRPTGISVYLKEGGVPLSLQQLKESLRLEYGSRITIRDRRTLTAEALRVFHETFAVTYVLQVLSLLISSLFLVLELIASILYRKRERLTLQSIGAPLSFLKGIVITEALTLASTAILLGLGIGAMLSWILVYRVNVLFFGWTVGFSLPVVQTALYVIGFFLLSAMLAWITVHLLFQSISAEELHYE